MSSQLKQTTARVPFLQNAVALVSAATHSVCPSLWSEWGKDLGGRMRMNEINPFFCFLGRPEVNLACSTSKRGTVENTMTAPPVWCHCPDSCYRQSSPPLLSHHQRKSPSIRWKRRIPSQFIKAMLTSWISLQGPAGHTLRATATASRGRALDCSISLTEWESLFIPGTR